MMFLKLSAFAVAISLASGFIIVSTQEDQLVSVVIHGTVVTDDDEFVANSQLQLSFIKTLLDENELQQQVDEMVVVTTDEEGRYSIQVNIDPQWSDFVLRLSTSGLDQIHFLEPQPKQLTERIRSGIESGSFEFEVNWIVESRPRWRELRLQIDRYGADSAKGRLLRQYGFPDREEEVDWKGGRRIVWYYYSEGMAVRFIGDEQEKVFHFKPRGYRPEQDNRDQL